MNVFGEYAQYYDLLYRDKDYAGEARFVDNLLRQHAPGSKHLLELGAGTGRHAALLAEMGYTIHGVERSSDMLTEAEAQANLLPPDVKQLLKFSQGDIRDIVLDKQFDAIISLFHVLSYQTTDEDLKAAFQTAQAHLNHGGIFLFDCWYGPTVLIDPPTVRVKRLENSAISVVRIAEPELLPNENVVVVNYTVFLEDVEDGSIKRITESHRMRYLFLPEIRKMFKDAGMELIALGEWLTNKNLGADTFGGYFIGRKSQD
jgi:SAM-dependent methyltransferase